MNTSTITGKLARQIDSHFQQVKAAPVVVEVAPDSIRAWIRERYRFNEPVPIGVVFDDVVQALWQWTEHASNPMHFGLFRPAVDRASVIADALVALFDPNLATWDFAPYANEVERHILSMLATNMNYDLSKGIANFTSGGEEANHTAVLVALENQFPQIGEQGVCSLKGQATFYVSAEGHHSFDKIACATGLGRSALRFIPVKSNLKMDLNLLHDAVKQDRKNGYLPFLVVGTAGTTGAGIVDDLDALASFAAAQGLWFHVDAAWGGAAALSPKLRVHLQGFAQAQSITFDAHKWLSVPTGAGMFFCHDRKVVERTFKTETPYVPEQCPDGRVYPFVTTMQWSRRFIGLKVFMMIAEHGLPNIVRRIEHQAEMGDYLRDRLKYSGWVLCNDTKLPVVCFTHSRFIDSPNQIVSFTQHMRQRKKAWISKVVLGGRLNALRACITNFRTSSAEIDDLVTELNIVNALESAV
jgi:aromatic-L-amino-acid decarboxylase